MWKAVFALRSSAVLVTRWESFLRHAGTVPTTPILYQHLTDLVLRMFLRRHYEIPAAQQSCVRPDLSSNEGNALRRHYEIPAVQQSCVRPDLSSNEGNALRRHYEIPAVQQSCVRPDLSSNEGNALRYAAGYVVRHVFKKIGKSNHSLKDDIRSCCQKLVKEDCIPHDQSTCEEWTDLVDRGGLWHVRETTFQLLCALEEEVRTYLNALSSPNTAGLRSADAVYREAD